MCSTPPGPISQTMAGLVASSSFHFRWALSRGPLDSLAADVVSAAAPPQVAQERLKLVGSLLDLAEDVLLAVQECDEIKSPFGDCKPRVSAGHP